MNRAEAAAAAEVRTIRAEWSADARAQAAETAAEIRVVRCDAESRAQQQQSALALVQTQLHEARLELKQVCQAFLKRRLALGVQV